MSKLLRALTTCAVIIQLALGAPATQGISKTARCGVSFGGLTCKGSSFGSCCSQYGYCGSNKDYCGQGCQSGYGTCGSSSSTHPSAQIVSTDGQCGTARGITCLGSKFGDCCSNHGWCGRSEAYCGKECNPLYGKCTRTEPSSSRSVSSQSFATSISSPSPSPPSIVSNNARCGSAYEAFPKGMTCSGSKFGNCCSQYSYCGSGKDYCGKGCQPGFGHCDASPSAHVSIPSSSVSSLKTSTIQATGDSSAMITPISLSSSATPVVSSQDSTLVVSSPSSTPPASSLSSTLDVPLSSSILVISSTAVTSLSSASIVAQSPSSSDLQSSTALSSIPSSSSSLSSDSLSSSSIASVGPASSSSIASLTPTPTPDVPSSSSVASTMASSTSVFSFEITTPSPVSSSEVPVSNAISSSIMSNTPAPTTLLIDGDFEATTASDVPWKIKLGGVTYDFMVPASVTTPYSGSQVGSVTYKSNSPSFVTMFGQPVKLLAGRTYKLSARYKSSRVNAGCDIMFSTAQPLGYMELTRILTIPASAIDTNWQEATGSYVHGATDSDLSFNVLTSCSVPTVLQGFSYYFDAITFTAV